MTSQTMTVRAAHFRSPGADVSGDLTCGAELPGLPEAQAAGCWVALRTRSRQERILAAELARSGMTAWTPTALVEERYGDCPVVVERPMIPGYVFLHGDADDVARANATGRVLDMIEFDDQPRIALDLASLSRATAAGTDSFNSSAAASVLGMLTRPAR